MFIKINNNNNSERKKKSWFGKRFSNDEYLFDSDVNNLGVKSIINYLNESKKLPNIDKEVNVEFRGFSIEEVEKRKKYNKKGIYNRDGVCAYDLNTGK